MFEVVTVPENQGTVFPVITQNTKTHAPKS